MARARELGSVLAELMPDEAEVLGLLATIRLAEGRRAGRLDDAGGLIPLDRQDRTAWDAVALADGCELAARAMRRSPPDRPGPYALHAAVAAVHSESPSYDQTDWPQVVALYDLLLAVQPSPVTALARATARSMVDGPAAALADVDELAADRRLARYPGVPATRADLLRRMERYHDAAVEYESAAGLTGDAAERAFLLDRAEQCRRG
ncbi:RNA polymerase sigma-70 factor (ECF subfamily) [Haloactinopolyspora alba]|uniref:RNA polymerase sigma-70 factor (ECF subfamily) n=1 Tax=Haloactinopolyspora alba TaxID=648780 RepID=A0A2P8DM05_9ACTN|nr:RNA polymerase sigma-70 factor (ECF subfamily) [Haloactinopolyspora alba]